MKFGVTKQLSGTGPTGTTVVVSAAANVRGVTVTNANARSSGTTPNSTIVQCNLRISASHLYGLCDASSTLPNFPIHVPAGQEVAIECGAATMNWNVRYVLL